MVEDSVDLPQSQLAVLPGMTQVPLVHRVDWLLSMAEGFLDSLTPEEA